MYKMFFSTRLHLKVECISLSLCSIGSRNTYPRFILNLLAIEGNTLHIVLPHIKLKIKTHLGYAGESKLKLSGLFTFLQCTLNLLHLFLRPLKFYCKSLCTLHFLVSYSRCITTFKNKRRRNNNEEYAKYFTYDGPSTVVIVHLGSSCKKIIVDLKKRKSENAHF